MFSEISSLNIVIDPAVQGTVDVALREVPWDQALDIILRANKLGCLVDGTYCAHRAARGAGGRRGTAPQAGRRTGAAGEYELLTRGAQLCEGGGAQGSADEERACRARTFRWTRRTNTHHHLGPTGLVCGIASRPDSARSTKRSRRWRSKRESFKPTRRSPGRWASSGASWARRRPNLLVTPRISRFRITAASVAEWAGSRGRAPADPTATTTGTVPSAVNLGAQAATERCWSCSRID